MLSPGSYNEGIAPGWEDRKWALLTQLQHACHSHYLR